MDLPRCGCHALDSVDNWTPRLKAPDTNKLDHGVLRPVLFIPECYSIMHVC